MKEFSNSVNVKNHQWNSDESFNGKRKLYNNKERELERMNSEESYNDLASNEHHRQQDKSARLLHRDDDHHTGEETFDDESQIWKALETVFGTEKTQQKTNKKT